MASMNVRELMEEGYSRADAKLIMQKRVFGEDVQFDRNGNPIEQGLGSASQPTIQSMQALAKHEGQEVADKAIAAATKAGKWPPRPRPEPEVS